MTEIERLIADIEKLFTKKTNTIYEIRIVYEPYGNTVNIFFEYYKIGYATTSQQIARLDSEYREQIPEIITKIRKETGLTVNTNI